MLPDLHRDLRFSIIEGALANVFLVLTGGLFLTGLALHLGLSEVWLGLLFAMPFLATVFQVPASMAVEAGLRIKPLCLWTPAVARLLWLPAVLACFLWPWPERWGLAAVLLPLLISYVAASINHVVWLAWMARLVPDRIRGRFFGARNMVCGAAGMVATLTCGFAVDALEGRFGGRGPGLGLTFGLAILGGLASIAVVRLISAPPDSPGVGGELLLGRLALPFHDPNYRRLLLFAGAWNFSVYLASPFYHLYLLREVGYDYSFVALLITVQSLTDLTTMRLWGRLSDRIKNKALLLVCGILAACLQVAWLFYDREGLILPILVHLLAGAVWAGIGLGSFNLALRLAPERGGAVYLATHNMVAGLAAAASPLLGGALAAWLGRADLVLFSWRPYPLQVIFLLSMVLRLASVHLLGRVHEPQEVELSRILRTLRRNDN